ncbi:MAG: hypothetical protein ACOC2F_09070, partial [Bacteroidota bacterium]
MKKRLFFLLFCLCSYNTLHAQLPVIAVQNDDAPQFFTVLEEAIDYAEDGDTLYLPGGSFLLMSEIDKELHFVGAGHYPDSASGGIITKIIGNVYLTSGADSCSFEGLYLDAIILANGSGYTNFISLSGLDIIRCSFDGITLGGSYSNANNDDNNVRNIYITECVLRNEIQGKNAKSVLLEKNIFTAPIRNFNGSVTISHCIFLSSNAIVSCSGLMVNNSIFHSDDYVYSYTENCTFNNSVFVYDFSS